MAVGFWTRATCKNVIYLGPLPTGYKLNYHYNAQYPVSTLQDPDNVSVIISHR